MNPPVGTVASESAPPTRGGTSPIVGGNNEADEGPASPSKVTTEPVYDDTKKLSDIFQGYLQSLSTGTAGGLTTMNGSLQPEAPQAPGNTLARGIGGFMQGNGKWVVLALVVLALVWYFKRRG